MGTEAGVGIAAHLSWCEQRNLRPATVAARGYALRRTEQVVGDLCLATEDAMRAWWAGLTIGPEARATELSHVKQWFKWAVLETLRVDDPTRRLIRPRLRSRIPRPIAEDDLALALMAASDRVRPWLLLAAYCGLRAGEIAGLRAEDVLELDGPAILVADGKSSRQRILPVPAAVMDALGPIPERGPLFPRMDGRSGHVAAHLVSHLANDELHRLGIAATLHQLRHRYATQVYRRSLDLRLTQDLLGHQSPVTTSRYAAYAPGRAREVTDSILV